MARILITHAAIFDATGAPPFVGNLLVDGTRIAAITASSLI
ncbi:MAG: hypothetical protein RLY97_430, partial [Pseudomonadota bacterium]